MTVAEMIAELEKLPRDSVVAIEGYLKDGDESHNGLLNPEYIEGLVDEDGVRAVIWASIVTGDEPSPGASEGSA